MAAAPLGTGSGEAGLPTVLEGTTAVLSSDSSTATTTTILNSEGAGNLELQTSQQNHLRVQQTQRIDLVTDVADGSGTFFKFLLINLAFR